MNKIDRRFLTNTSIYVDGMISFVPEELAAGDRYILSAKGKDNTAWAGVPKNSIAYYDGANWTFTYPEVNDIVYIHGFCQVKCVKKFN